MMAICLIVALCRLRYMFWTDVAHHEILAARLDGSQFVRMVISGITTPGMQLALAQFLHPVAIVVSTEKW